MTVKLTNNFLANARGLTLTDGGGIVWTINLATNAITAAGSAGAVLSSVGLADESTAPIYTIGSSPLIANGTLTLTLNTQSLGKVFAGPVTGSPAQPTFRALVAADIPQLAYSSLSGTPTIPSGANPSATVGLTAVNGSAATYMRSDGAPALSQSIAPTWTGGHTFSPASGQALTINGAANSYCIFLTASGTAGGAFGQFIRAGTNSTDYALFVQNQAGTANFLLVRGDGNVIIDGTAPGTAVLNLNTQATTGSKTASFSASNKPGTNNQTTPSTWLPLLLDGTTYYIPAFAA